MTLADVPTTGYFLHGELGWLNGMGVAISQVTITYVADGEMTGADNHHNGSRLPVGRSGTPP